MPLAFLRKAGARRPLRTRRHDLIRTILLAVVSTAFSLALGTVLQAHLDAALRRDWLIVVLAFVVSALTVALPGRLPLIASFVALLAFGYASTSTAINGFAIFCCVMGGFFFGVCARSLLSQWKHWDDPREQGSPGAS
ncbi:MAG: hypothetical protein M3N46_04510 [Actinomycetota bacterium]|nr:hypothetical protein [Actinomycetota bacterium]